MEPIVNTGLGKTHTFVIVSYSKGGSVPDWTVSLALGILHEFGCIWELKWCPSGAWEDPGLDCQVSGSFSLTFVELSMSLAVSGN